MCWECFENFNELTECNQCGFDYCVDCIINHIDCQKITNTDLPECMACGLAYFPFGGDENQMCKSCLELYCNICNKCGDRESETKYYYGSDTSLCDNCAFSK